MSGRVWFLTELFYPDQTSTGYIMTRIAEHVAQEADVTVLCGPAHYDDSPLAVQAGLHTRVTVTRVPLGNWNKNQLVTRGVRSILLAVKLAARLFIGSTRGDTVVLVTNPALLLLLVSLFCRRRELRLIILVHDVFPENLVAARILKPQSVLYGLLRRMFDRAYGSADQLIVLGRDMRDLLEVKTNAASTAHISIIENWAETEAVHPVACEDEGPIRLQFAGNFGRVQGLLPLLEAIWQADNPHVTVDFIGGGAMCTEMQAFINQHSLHQVRILPPYARERQQVVLNECDIAIVSLAEGMLGLGVPSKAYNSLAAGKPILFIGHPHSEIAQVVSEAKVGWVVPGFGTALVESLRNLGPAVRSRLRPMGLKARQLAESRYSEKRQLDAYRAIILG